MKTYIIHTIFLLLPPVYKTGVLHVNPNTPYQSLITELDRRAIHYPGRKTNQFTGVLRCGICAQTMWTFYNANFGAAKTRIWRCSSRVAHVVISHKDALQKVADALKVALAAGPSSMAPSDIPNYAAQIADLQARRKRLEDGYLAGLFDLQAVTVKATELDDQMTVLQTRQNDQAHTEQVTAARRAAMSDLATMIEQIPDYLANGPPQEINRLLHLMCSAIIVQPNSQVRLVFR